MTHYKHFLWMVFFVTCFSFESNLFAFGEKPTFDEKEPTKLERVLGLNQAQEGSDSAAAAPASRESSSLPVAPNQFKTPGENAPTADVLLSDEELEIRRKIERSLKQKQFDKVQETLQLIPASVRTPEDHKMLDKLSLFSQIEQLEKDEESQFKKGETVDEQVMKDINRLYRSAQAEYLNNRPDLARDLLIQSLYKDRKNFKSKKFLELGLNMPLGSYKVENVEEQYWKSSLINIYSGYPAKAVEDLKVLEVFDPENPEIFKRMGSSYYSMGQPKEAVQAWKRALYLEPENKDLEKFIENAQDEITRQERLAKAQMNKKADKPKEGKPTIDMQVLRITTDSNVAYSYAQEVRKQLPGIEVVVEEQENGKWAVMIPKN